MCDFIILTLPRSGSHMLASALDSHPQISCEGEIWRADKRYPFLGAVRKQVHGGILMYGVKHYVDLLGKKIICLLRDHDERLRSLQNTGILHFLETTVVDKKSDMEIEHVVKEQAANRNSELLRFATDNGALVLHYEDITEGKDVREISASIVAEICEFLGVNMAPMKTLFFKPK